jgi:hypothetical protein
LLMIGIIVLIPILACDAIGIYDPEATQVAMDETVVALQATIAVLESKASQSRSVTPQIRVVTATPKPSPSPIIASSTFTRASSLGQTIKLTGTPRPSPITTISPQPQTTILVATFTPTPAPESYPNAPAILKPGAGAVVEGNQKILLQWSWNNVLGPDQYYDIKIRPDGQDRSIYVVWEKGEAHNLQASLPPGRYYWTVQIVKGYYKNGNSQPEDRVFEGFLSPESEPRLIIIAPRDDDGKTPTPTPPPVIILDDGDAGDENTSGEPSSDTSDETPTEPLR